jgi:hypothetical protein
MEKGNYERGRQLVQRAPQLYIDLDVEADGKPGHGSLLSVGAVTPWGAEFYRELKPTSEIWVPSQREFCEDHGLQRERLLREGVHPGEAMHELDKWTREQQRRQHKMGSVMVGFNIGFDFPWIDLEMQRAGKNNPYGISGMDIKSRALGLSSKYNWRDTAKGKLPADITPEGDFTHHALEDAKYQQKIHFALAGKLALLRPNGAKTKREVRPEAKNKVTTTKEQELLVYHYGWDDENHYCTNGCNNGAICQQDMDGFTTLMTPTEAIMHKLHEIRARDDDEEPWDDELLDC